MKSLNECILESRQIFESSMSESQLSKILKDAEKWNTKANWIKYESKNGNDPDEIDEDYFYTEMDLCNCCIWILQEYLEDDADELLKNGKVDLDLLSDKLTDELAERADNGDLGELDESEYFDSWEDYIIVFKTAWESVTKKPFFIEL